MNELLLILVAYLLGSIPTAVWTSRYFFGIDIRDYGSGNSGATNTYRVLGSKWGTFVMIVDMLKAIVAVKLVFFMPYAFKDDLYLVNMQLGLGLAAVLGHIFPIWANFRGGKGVASLFGMVLGIQPNVALCCVGIFILVLYLTRWVSLSSILASVAFPIFILFIFNEPEDLYRIFAVAVGMLVLLTHQKNINRILKGNESKVPILKHRDRRRRIRK
ncbi:glycerol-3-phosphate 1-O-acyltransferase PlsY [Flaviaesturariibacter aridisoli]|uniref:Glycerol-3-phosphate acyltransferase n=1 Tax=Flaviaesturariibacter aridisoli TaxID=2545761 RepID=A0A4R4E3C0_9BACT|nr:glycerol-3-phosphate 1-O-acyltransferase PlsY [Flaviaesturariibacter aridisoli]TCZ73899.1 glycerol-3-phosphate 1-O-acyltransferase [Flaviaesturariibacter aridisoli]